MGEDRGFTRYFGVGLAQILAEKIQAVYKPFNSDAYIKAIHSACEPLSYTQRVALHAAQLHRFLPEEFITASDILIAILGEENKNQTGMFTEYYWVLPIGKYIELYGLAHFDQAMNAIEEITKRNTGEYAVRPYIRMYPDRAIRQMKVWAVSENFHLRRLASEGLRPKLPWATKLDTFIANPQPVFSLLQLLKEDNVMFVKKSVANHLTDWLKVNFAPTAALIRQWQKSENQHTQWIIRRATRKITVDY